MRLLPIVLFALPLPAFADSFTVSSAPTAVTVYTGLAMVTRDISLDVPAGTHEVILPDLPRWLDANSLRVQVDGALLGATRLRTDALPPQPDRDSAPVTAAKARIDDAERNLRDLDDRIEDAQLAADAADARAVFLSGVWSSETLPSEPQALASVAEMIEAQTLSAKKAQVSAKRDAREIAESRPDLEKALADAKAALAALMPPVDTRSLLALTVTAANPGTLNARISYPVNASWQPTYDVLLTQGGAPRVDIRRAAVVSQSSGEAWEDVSMTLSTLQPLGQIAPSELDPPLLWYTDPVQLKARSAPAAEMLQSSEPVMGDAGIARPRFDGPGVSYAVSAPISIAAGAEGAHVALDALTFDARVFARAIPANDSTAFLMAQATNTTQEPLLPADVAQIYVDGALVGRSSFAEVPAGDDIVQAFGSIEDLRLTRTVLDRSEGGRGIISRSSAQTQEIRLDIENLGQKIWPVELLEAAPYTEQDDLTIQWNAQPKPDEINVDDRRGLVQWNFDLDPQASQQILIDQDIRWPEGKVLR